MSCHMEKNVCADVMSQPVDFKITKREGILVSLTKSGCPFREGGVREWPLLPFRNPTAIIPREASGKLILPTIMGA